MLSNFSNLSEEELIAILNQGNLSKEDFSELLEAMENKGLRGTFVPESDIDSPEAQAMIDYIEYHKKIKTYWSKSEVDEFIEILLNINAELESKRKALVSLAHIPKPEVFEALKQYYQKPDEELKIWSQMALDECRAFLESDILGEEKISITSLTGGKGDKLRFYLVFLAKNLTNWPPDNKKTIENIISEINNEDDWDVEDIEIGGYFFIVTALHAFDQAPAELVELIIEKLNQDEAIIREECFCTNTHKPTEEEIARWEKEIKI